ncbi:hypothetical protein BWQ96_02868 [Gracilariopsis chorda]|uniref:Uncharacterized protein n=1 Tax=Gracilariopsis chorda TaxID=448386 RepID=A0A2V3IZ12_9FLOR|nr:hypothetical protein BWQ96_02868 [Gracilariopsis chorda]|eukprot:PXF47388.1 hypothetical protein BWQ96_02868 [Gracilariopsis chorda]
MNSHSLCDDLKIDEQSEMLIDNVLENRHAFTWDWNSELFDSNFSYLLSFPCTDEIENENDGTATTRDFKDFFKPSIPHHEGNRIAISSPSDSSQTVPSFTHNSSPLLGAHREDLSRTQADLDECHDEDMLEMKIKDIKKDFARHSSAKAQERSHLSVKKEIQKPPTTAGITLDDLKAVFHLERPKAEKTT